MTSLHLKRSKQIADVAMVSLGTYITRDYPGKDGPSALSFLDAAGEPQLVYIYDSEADDNNYCLDLTLPGLHGQQDCNDVLARPGSIEPIHLSICAVSLDRMPQAEAAMAELMRTL